MTIKSSVKTGSVLAVALLAVLGVYATPVGAQIINPANNHTYEMLPAAAPPDHIADAIAQGGYLVTINDDAENSWIMANFSGTEMFYIGFTDDDAYSVEGTFVWVNGETPGYDNWQTGEPNDSGSGEDWVYMFPAGGGPFSWPAGIWADVTGLPGDYFGDDGLKPGLMEMDVGLGPTATITRSATSPDADSAFTAGSGSWDVEFSEAVLNVDGTDFSLDTLGTAAATGPTVTGGPTSYVASISGVGGTGSITLNFNVGNVVAEGDGTTPALAASSGSQWFSNVVAAPAATGWMLVFLGLVLFLAATVVIRRKALKH